MSPLHASRTSSNSAYVILIVAGEPLIQMWLTARLSDAGYRFAEVHESDAAREEIAHLDRYDLVLLGSSLAGLDSRTLLQAILAQDRAIQIVAAEDEVPEEVRDARVIRVASPTSVDVLDAVRRALHAA